MVKMTIFHENDHFLIKTIYLCHFNKREPTASLKKHVLLRIDQNDYFIKTLFLMKSSKLVKTINLLW